MKKFKTFLNEIFNPPLENDYPLLEPLDELPHDIPREPLDETPFKKSRKSSWFKCPLCGGWFGVPSEDIKKNTKLACPWCDQVSIIPEEKKR